MKNIKGSDYSPQEKAIISPKRQNTEKTPNSKRGKALYRVISYIMYICFGFILVTALFFGGIRCVAYPVKYKEEVYLASDKYQLDRALVLAIIKVESSFNYKAESRAGAIGLMQITRSTADMTAEKLDLVDYDIYNPLTNIEIGCCYFRYLLDKFVYLDTALCAYNAGEGNVSVWLKNNEYSKDGKLLEKVPFLETENFVKRVNKSYSGYKKFYNNILDKK